MGDAITQVQFYERIQLLEDKMMELHRSGRKHIDEVADKLEAKLDKHERDDQVVENRVLIIETERKEEARKQIRNGSMAGILAAAGLSGLIEGVKHLWK